mmetsp:Transcript_20668/g.35533  ORF Transcript_20668/g.35533 Transcript_20668/m.35533 type:complete len:131 (+) Transcript_20668:375-767(+)
MADLITCSARCCVDAVSGKNAPICTGCAWHCLETGCKCPATTELLTFSAGSQKQPRQSAFNKVRRVAAALYRQVPVNVPAESVQQINKYLDHQKMGTHARVHNHPAARGSTQLYDPTTWHRTDAWNGAED